MARDKLFFKVKISSKFFDFFHSFAPKDNLTLVESENRPISERFNFRIGYFIGFLVFNFLNYEISEFDLYVSRGFTLKFR